MSLRKLEKLLCYAVQILERVFNTHSLAYAFHTGRLVPGAPPPPPHHPSERLALNMLFFFLFQIKHIYCNCSKPIQDVH